ncbi:MAG TPA: SDR family NAD(P)-dependent oxidoreductase [Phototrophicaceae bacterium]|nr:SDR family NAD(P)-dependent oxidoreductase [Phototrophicaceae bacterium]
MAFSDQTVLVTGATGFLGGALALRLARDGMRVRALARSPQKAAFLREANIEIVEGDILDAEAMQHAAQSCQIVFHVAAGFGSDYEKQHQVNVGGTRNVLQAAADAGTDRFVHVSSISIYGYNYSGDVTEEMQPAPGADPYGITKAEGESVVRAGSIPYTIIRPGMIYGPRSVNWTGMLFKVARISPTPFVGRGLGSAFPIHVDDVVDLMVVAANHPAAANQIFNCAPDPAPTWREFLGRYAELSGHDRWLPLPPALVASLAWAVMLVSPTYSMGRDLPDQVRFIQREITYKMDKARDLLGWSPRIDLDEGIASCVPWLRDQGLLP